MDMKIQSNQWQHFFSSLDYWYGCRVTHLTAFLFPFIYSLSLVNFFVWWRNNNWYITEFFILLKLLQQLMQLFSSTSFCFSRSFDVKPYKCLFLLSNTKSFTYTIACGFLIELQAKKTQTLAVPIIVKSAVS